MTDVKASLDAIDAIMKARNHEWVANASELGAMLEAMLQPETILLKDSILEPANIDAKTRLVESKDYRPLINGTKILVEWRAWLKQTLQSRGKGMSEEHHALIKKFAEIINSARDQTDLVWAVHEIAVVIPAIKNLPQRKAAAAKSIADWKAKQKQFDLGKSLSDALARLASGGAALLQVEPEAPTTGGLMLGGA